MTQDQLVDRIAVEDEREVRIRFYGPLESALSGPFVTAEHSTDPTFTGTITQPTGLNSANRQRVAGPQKSNLIRDVRFALCGTTVPLGYYRVVRRQDAQVPAASNLSSKLVGTTPNTVPVAEFAHYFQVVASLADIAGPGPVVGGDGEATADDIILFISWFSGQDPRADVAGPGGTQGADGEFTADDIILFISWFNAFAVFTPPSCTAQVGEGEGEGGEGLRGGQMNSQSAGGNTPGGNTLDAAEIIAMQQLINLIPPGPQRDAAQAQLLEAINALTGR